MRIGALLLSLVAAAPSARSAGQAPAPECATAPECQAAVESALASESFAAALDLAWRAVQKGPKDDPGLMFLLARAQSRAGRPQDALVMVRRLAERGVATDAATHPDLQRMRDMPDWSALEAMVARVATGAPAVAPVVPPVPATRSATSTPSVAPNRDAARADRGESARAAAPVAVDAAMASEDALRFRSDRFVPAGLAYDAVSRRFVVGDELGRKLRVIGEGLDHAVDLVRAESAGFFDIRALAIDPRRGDLWVVSSDAAGTSGTLHRIQLISGRPLQSWPLGGDTARPVQPVDVAVADSGAVFVLARDGRMLRTTAGAAAVEQIATLASVAPTFSLALAPDGGVAYVTHPSGVVRLDLAARSLSPVTSPAEVPLTAIERLRAHRDGFVGMQRGADGQARLVRIELSRNGRDLRRVTTYDVHLEAGTTAAAFTIAGDEVSLVAGGTSASGGAAPAPPSTIGSPADLVVRRIRLR